MIHARIYLIIFILATVGCLFYYLAPEGEGESPSPVGLTGDWVVAEDTEIKDDELIINGNLSIVNGSTLTFINCTVNFTKGNVLTVEDGAVLVLFETTLDGVTDEDYYKFYVNGSLKVEGATLSQTRGPMDVIKWKAGLQIKSGQAWIRNTTFSNSVGPVIGVNKGMAELQGCRIEECGSYGLFVEGASVVDLQDCEFDNSELDIIAQSKMRLNRSIIGVLNMAHRAQAWVDQSNIDVLSFHGSAGAWFYNTTVSDKIYLVDNSHVVFINSSFNMSNVMEMNNYCTVKVGGFINVKVMDNTRVPQAYATVRIDNTTDEDREFFTAGQDGWVRWKTGISFVYNGEKIYDRTPHEIVAISEDLLGYKTILVGGGIYFVTIVVNESYPYVLLTRPENGELNINSNPPEIQIVFSQAMKEESVEDVIKLNPSGIDYNTMWNIDRTRLTIIFGNNLVLGKNYSISISMEAQSFSGQTLFGDYTYWFHTVEKETEEPGGDLTPHNGTGGSYPDGNSSYDGDNNNDDDGPTSKIMWALIAFSLGTVLVIIIVAIVGRNRPPLKNDHGSPQYKTESPCPGRPRDDDPPGHSQRRYGGK